ncbi:hypothetical protein LLG96_19795 [bacterium]|nr:hypothetical protein [bacterium]
MIKRVCALLMTFFILTSWSVSAEEMNIDELLRVFTNKVSGSRARDYTMRLWRYDKWSTLPMWKNTMKEVRSIMRERAFDEAEVVDTPADGVTQFGTWTNPLGWDVKQATLEVIEPANIPDEYRYLCNYTDNPTSLNNWSCPTPPGGIETGLVLLENPDPEELKKLDAKGKIVLVDSGSRGLKRYLAEYGVLGLVSDEIEEQNSDFINANQWLNGWTDLPGGWLMSASDDRHQFGFSISQKKAGYLRNLLRQGTTVRVRAVIDSRYYTDDTIPYATGCVKGTEPDGQEIIIGGHLLEWGANDNCTGSSAILEAIGTINDLVRSGVLPAPGRTIRLWFGHEVYGSNAFTVYNLERLRTKAIASVNCDSPAVDHELSTTSVTMVLNPNCAPSFTDALFAEIIKRYHERYIPYKHWHTEPYIMMDIFPDPMVGVPTNAITLYNFYGERTHHNSMDTIEKVDPRSLHDLSTLMAVYVYYLACAGYDETPLIERLTFDRGVGVILEKSRDMTLRLTADGDGNALGKALDEGSRTISYYAELQKQALRNIERLVQEKNRAETQKDIARYMKKTDEFCEFMTGQYREAVREKAEKESLKIVKYSKGKGTWEQEAETIIPKRTTIGTITLEGIPRDQWKVVKSSSRWWSPTNWGNASYWWCDGRRNLNEIRELVELEAGRPVVNFDLIAYYKFLKEQGLVEFVQK